MSRHIVKPDAAPARPTGKDATATSGKVAVPAAHTNRNIAA